MAAGGAVVLVAHSFELRINTTDSMPIGLYREVPLRMEHGKGVVFCLPQEIARLGRERGYLRQGSCADGSQELFKVIAALPGDRIFLSRLGFTVNDSLIPGTALRAADRSKRSLPHAYFGERRVGPNELWVLGLDRRLSWDSRYFGPIPLTYVRASAIPVFTFGSP
jgi:conjugative transfer signal peptidase TraF